MRNQEKLPIVEALRRHTYENRISMHVPGHKNGRVFPEEGYDLFQSVLPIDVTEITGLDDLHAPEGAIRESEGLLRELYGSLHSFFLVNGTTSGNLAMIMAACEEGDVVFVQRNCHKSILHGLMLARVKPVFITPELVEGWGIGGGITQEGIREALRVHPSPKAVIITCPTYYGTGLDLSQLVSFCHSHGMLVLADEAHGAHFTLGAPFPEGAVSAGADIVVQSAHKTLPAMTMGSFLHLNSHRVEKEKLRFYLQLFQSSSPSYPIMASLDLARRYLADFTVERIRNLSEAVGRFRSDLRSIEGISVMEGPNLDPLKITLSSNAGVSGYKLQQAFEGQNIYPELADPRNVLFILPLDAEAIRRESGRVIGGIARSLEDMEPEGVMPDMKDIHLPETISRLELSFQEMEKHEIVQHELWESTGQIAGESIIPYPPGIPLLLKGERITQEILTVLEHYMRLGARFHGGEGLSENKIAVFNKLA
ncbi:aminotransferase class I/II-fold pyridoxal phosphate-dependent enzyme [Peribacillus sp. SCS-37]|uniref:aminotransferase class I/II-fold pyridoxal phosphate-dependent enzyme n=1 Tax=Paraperibacillus esterisolvens TaxID=3115296 RepID=UPI0039063421